MSGSEHRRIMNAMARGKVTRADDTHGLQLLDVDLMQNETKKRVERFQQYGFSSVPYADAEVTVLFPGGSRDHGVIISTDDRGARVRGMSAGEVAMYTGEGDYLAFQSGNVVKLATMTLIIKADTSIDITTPAITIHTPETNWTGNLHVTGNIDATGSINAPSGQVGSHVFRYEVRGRPAGLANSMPIGWLTTLADAEELVGISRDSGRWENVLIVERLEEAPAARAEEPPE